MSSDLIQEKRKRVLESIMEDLDGRFLLTLNLRQDNMPWKIIIILSKREFYEFVNDLKEFAELFKNE